MRRNTREERERIYRGLALALRQQSQIQLADKYAFRAEKLQLNGFIITLKVWRWPVPVALWLLTGFGYKLWRIFLAYVIVVVLFAALYLVAAGHLAPDALSNPIHRPTVAQFLDALQTSFNAIHGRVFFAQIFPDSPSSWIATGESIVGIGIEGIFVAMLVQRFFSR